MANVSMRFRFSFYICLCLMNFQLLRKIRTTIFFHIIFPSRRQAKFLHFRMPPIAHHISMHYTVFKFKSIQQCMQKITSHQRDRTNAHSHIIHIHLTNTIPRHADSATNKRPYNKTPLLAVFVLHLKIAVFFFHFSSLFVDVERKM